MGLPVLGHPPHARRNDTYFLQRTGLECTPSEVAGLSQFQFSSTLSEGLCFRRHLDKQTIHNYQLLLCYRQGTYSKIVRCHPELLQWMLLVLEASLNEIAFGRV